VNGIGPSPKGGTLVTLDAQSRRPRVLVGGYSHELNSFVPGRMTEDDIAFAGPTVTGDDLFGTIVGQHLELNAIADVARAEGIDLVGTRYVLAGVGPRVPDASWERMRDDILDGLRLDPHGIDGVLLVIHGATASESVDDTEGLILQLVRDAVGPDIPVAACFDLHAHGTPAMSEAADILVGFNTCPHIDYYETGEAAMRLLVRAIRGETRPITVQRKLRMMTPALSHDSNHGPMVTIQAAARQLEQRPGILSVSVFATQPWMDVPDLGWSVVVVGDEDEPAANAAADELAWRIWDLREALRYAPISVDDAIDIAEASEAIPVVFSDGGDTTTGGGHGDGNHLLRALLARGYPGSAAIAVTDAPAVAACFAAGVGERVTVPVGGTLSPGFFSPVEVTGVVETLADGHYDSDLPVRPRNVGRIATLLVGGIHIVLTEVKAPQLDASIYRRAGIEVRHCRIVQAKSAGGFRGYFEPFAAAIVDVDGPGPCDADLLRLPFRHITRPLWPWDADLAEPWPGAIRP
jgi:microcystin degradation protein MlrC